MEEIGVKEGVVWWWKSKNLLQISLNFDPKTVHFHPFPSSDLLWWLLLALDEIWISLSMSLGSFFSRLFLVCTEEYLVSSLFDLLSILIFLLIRLMSDFSLSTLMLLKWWGNVKDSLFYTNSKILLIFIKYEKSSKLTFDMCFGFISSSSDFSDFRAI